MDEGDTKSTLEKHHKTGTVSPGKDPFVTSECFTNREIPFQFCGAFPKVLLVSPSSTLAWVIIIN